MKILGGGKRFLRPGIGWGVDSTPGRAGCGPGHVERVRFLQLRARLVRGLDARRMSDAGAWLLRESEIVYKGEHRRRPAHVALAADAVTVDVEGLPLMKTHFRIIRPMLVGAAFLAVALLLMLWLAGAFHRKIGATGPERVMAAAGGRPVDDSRLVAARRRRTH